MKIVRYPFHASIQPHPGKSGRSEGPELSEHALWHCVIRRDGSPEVVAQHDARRKEDAMCVARLELVRLQRSTPGTRRAS